MINLQDAGLFREHQARLRRIVGALEKEFGPEADVQQALAIYDLALRALSRCGAMRDPTALGMLRAMFDLQAES